MKASCIGAAGMTPGVGPSYQVCLTVCRKLNFLRPIIIIVLCICIWLHRELKNSIQAYFGWWTEERKWTSAGRNGYRGAKSRVFHVKT